jgi:hypothetical protein
VTVGGAAPGFGSGPSAFFRPIRLRSGVNRCNVRPMKNPTTILTITAAQLRDGDRFYTRSASGGTAGPELIVTTRTKSTVIATTYFGGRCTMAATAKFEVVR